MAESGTDIEIHFDPTKSPVSLAVGNLGGTYFRQGCKFDLTARRSIYGIRLYYVSPGPGHARIETDSGGFPSGTLADPLMECVKTPADLSGLDGTWIDFLFPDDVVKEIGTYHIVFKTDEAGSPGDYHNLAKETLAMAFGYEQWDSGSSTWASTPDQGLYAAYLYRAYAFVITGDDQNCTVSNRMTDYENLSNVVKMTGYGDGINQIESYADHCTSGRTRLTADTTASGTEDITVEDASWLSDSGEVWVGCEKFAYTGLSPVVDAFYYIENPAEDSSVNYNGVKEKLVSSKDAIDQSALDIMAESYLLEHCGIGDTFSPPERIAITAVDTLDSLMGCSIGDITTVDDVEAGMTGGEYRIFSREYVYDTGIDSLNYEISNVGLNLLEEIKKSTTDTAKLSQYMQGATNIFSVNETENAEYVADPSIHNVAGPVDVFFTIPDDTIGLNSIKLSYRNETPRTYSINTGAKQPNDVYGVSTTSDTLISLNNDTWTVVSTLPDPGADGEYVYNISQVVTNVNGDATFYARLVQNGAYYPNATGIWIIVPPNFSMTFSILAPINPNNGAVTLEVKQISGITVFNGITSNWMCYTPHVHTVSGLPIAYDINTGTYTTASIRILTTNNASGTPTWTERTAQLTVEHGTLVAYDGGVMTDIDITEFFAGTGCKGVRLAVNGNSRHKIQVTIKCFIQSKTI